MEFLGICVLLGVVLLIVDRHRAWKRFGRVMSVLVVIAVLTLAVVLEVGREAANRQAQQITITPDTSSLH